MRWPCRRISLRRIVWAVLSLHGLLLAYGAYVHSPAFDEVGHMVAGLSHWQTGNLQLYCVNPPLVRLLATLPVLVDPPFVDWQQVRVGPFERPEFSIGPKVLCSQPWQQTRRQFAWARWACIPFSLLAGWVIYYWSKQLFGIAPACLALGLWCFCPLVLGHAQMITPDTGAAALGLAAHYLFWKWLQNPGWGLAVLCGILLGLAELTKFTWVILPFVWLGVWIVLHVVGAATGSRTRQLVQLLLIGLIGLWVINAGYGYAGTLQPLGKYRFVSQALGGRYLAESNPPTGNRFLGSWLAYVPVPVPEQYLLGIDRQKRDFEGGMWSYLGGEWRLRGWWYYYVYGLLVKLPLGTWLVWALAVVLTVVTGSQATRWRDEFILLAPAIAVIVFVSSQTGFNHHLRYVLPALPFLYIWASKCGQVLHLKMHRFANRLGAAAVVGAIAFAIVSSLAVYPHSLSYFHELSGGPTRGHAHLVDSNIDWGQDLWYLKHWCQRHPEATPIHIAYWNVYPATVADLVERTPPSGPQFFGKSVPFAAMVGPLPGWFAVSVNHLRAYDRRYEYFLHFEPAARAGYSIYIYHLETHDVNRVRKQLGLPEIDSVNVTGQRASQVQGTQAAGGG